MAEDVRRLVGRNVARLRAARGLTQEELAERSGLSQQYLSGLERGGRNPTLLSLARVAEALGATLADLLEPPPPGREGAEGGGGARGAAARAGARGR